VWRASLALCALVSVAFAEGEPAAASDAALRTRVSAQLSAELDVISRTLETVTAKLTETEAMRARRLRAAYRVLRTPLRASATDDDRMAAARRRAGARYLADRDLGERDLLADEVAKLRAAYERTLVALGKLPGLSMPSSLVRPARGSIARRFGTLVHERSRAELSRRGLDFQVEHQAQVVAPADGTVRYAGPVRGLDHGVIIDHGDYFTVVAKLGDVVVPAGAPVHRGEVIGRAHARRVYLEVRVRLGPGGVPIDPEPLLESPATESR
jgi:septal ring factor EnvC (AmiA/AmiB activator)